MKTKYNINSIFLADDDDDDRLLFSTVIRDISPSIKLEYVSDGRQLMELLKHVMPDLLFLDLDMPYKNGLECLIEIGNTPGLQDMPRVVFSSTTRSANIQTAYEMGAHLFLVKSSLMSEYQEAIQSILFMDWSDPLSIKEKYCVQGRYAAFG